MLPEPGSPEDWLRYANSDLAVARLSAVQGVLWETLCFHAQQAAEKAIKAVLLHHRIEFPRTHSIERLVRLLPSQVERTPELLSANKLTPYGTVLRCPDEAVTVSEQDYREALDSAEAVFVWAESIVRAAKGR